MSDIVDKWVEKLADAPNIGEMTHRERVEKAFRLEDPDMVPACPELDEWQILYAGYDFFETWDNYEKCTDSVLKTFADFRPDCIWPYVCPSHVLDPYLTADQRAKAYHLRDGRSYVVFDEITHDLDEAIKQFEGKPWQKYGLGRLGSHYLPHFNQLLEFRDRTGNKVPVVLAIANASNIAEWFVGVQHFIEWTVTQPKEKVHYYMEMITEQLLGVIDACKPYADAGVKFLCIFGGARTWGPRQFEEFGIYDTIIANAAAEVFEFPFHHICGYNLPYAMANLATMPYKAIQLDEPMQQLAKQGWTWAKWSEWVARMYRGKLCAMNAPTCQAACYDTPEEIQTMVKEFIEHTTPWTTAVMMPGCELSVLNPVENVHAMIDATRKWGKYPECKTAAIPLWTDEEFEASLDMLGITKRYPERAYRWRRFNGDLPVRKSRGWKPEPVGVPA